MHVAGRNKPLIELFQAGAALFRVGSRKPPTGDAGRVSDRPALVEKAHQEGLQEAIYVGRQVLGCHLIAGGAHEQKTHKKGER